jgi:hypothetical protein
VTKGDDKYLPPLLDILKNTKAETNKELYQILVEITSFRKYSSS